MESMKRKLTVELGVELNATMDTDCSLRTNCKMTFEASSSTERPYEAFIDAGSLARPGGGGSDVPYMISRPPHMSNGVVGIFVLSLVLISLALLLAICYLMLRFCNRTDETLKRDRNIQGWFSKISTIIAELFATPDVIPHPKRIYELQAEEGCYSCAPTLNGKSLGMSEVSSSVASLKDSAIHGNATSCPASVNVRHVETGSLNRCVD
ncbi:unnamed protein product [Toxocara canis]|uniref:LAM_G_DOMAIN domain-containing protein n=1 Tax=Toxocara canis TaxID=6265 RepID=A0A183UJL8_TOXCA|nr:unnamed protein product [Toxocara canis]